MWVSVCVCVRSGLSKIRSQHKVHSRFSGCLFETPQIFWFVVEENIVLTTSTLTCNLHFRADAHVIYEKPME